MRAFELLTLSLAAAALWALVTRPPAGRPALAGDAALVATVPGLPPPPAPTAPPPAPTAPPPLPAAGGQAELWPGYRDALCAGWHAGAIDFCAPEGTPVFAPADGTLTAVGAYDDVMRYGAYVILTTPAGVEIYVGHLNHATVNPLGLAVGSWVAAGTPIGELSAFAYSQPHSHVQLRVGGALVGPDAWWATWDGR